MKKERSFARSASQSKRYLSISHFPIQNQPEEKHGRSSSDSHAQPIHTSGRHYGSFVGTSNGTTMGSTSIKRRSSGVSFDTNKPWSATSTGKRSYQDMERLKRPSTQQGRIESGYTKSWMCPHSHSLSPYIEGDEGTMPRIASYKIECLHKGLPVIDQKPSKPKQKAKKSKEETGSYGKVSKELTSEQVDSLLQMADMFDWVKTTVTDHDERMGEYQAILGQVENAVQCLRKTLGTCQLIWKIDGFKTKFKDAAKGENTVLYSPAFETHPYGYKLAISLCPYGDGAGKGKYMSIFFTVIQSKWDPLLNWPFGHKVTFTLLDQSDSGETRDIQANFEPNPIKENMPFLGKPTSYRNPSLGLPKFAPLTEVWSGEKYVKDNTIFIKIAVEITEAIGI